MNERLLLTVDNNPKGKGKLAVITRGGHPQLDKEMCEVVALEILPTMKAAKAWFRDAKITRP